MFVPVHKSISIYLSELRYMMHSYWLSNVVLLHCMYCSAEKDSVLPGSHVVGGMYACALPCTFSSTMPGWQCET